MAVIALLSDLGLRDSYVGVMKAVIYGIAPQAPLIDLSHEVQAHNVRDASFVLLTSYRYLPENSLLCCVVDPGVGSHRRGVAVALRSEEGQRLIYVGPDNGLATSLLERCSVEAAVSLENSQYQRHPVSATFHGRDIFAPAAAHLFAGLDIEALGPSIAASSLVHLAWPQAQQHAGVWHAHIINADRFGNLITNIHVSNLQPQPTNWQVSFGDHIHLGAIRRTFTDVHPGIPLAYIGSSGFMEIAIRDGNAKRDLEYDTETTLLVSPIA